MENNRKKIVLVDDNEEISTFLNFELSHEGYNVEYAKDGIQGLNLIRKTNPDLIILDWEMPNMSGIEVCRRIRKDLNTPILMLTAKKTLQDKVEGLDTGATDYLTKPFELDELMARIRALLRRNNQPVKETDALVFENIKIDKKTHEVFVNNKIVELSPKEFELLSLLLQNPRQVLSKSYIYEKVWGWDSDGNESAVEVYIHSLRAKLEKESKQRMIHTKRGAGYILRAD